jgi:hypothetical protein
MLMKKTISTVSLLLIGLAGLQAQENTVATGGKATGSVGTVSYSVGQVFYTTNTGTTGSVAQGVQQHYEISEVTAVEGAKFINLAAYPNPTTDFLQLSIETEKLQDLSFQLYDMSGKLLRNEPVTDNLTSIQMSDFVPAMYFVKVIQGDKEVKTFKIIKK